MHIVNSQVHLWAADTECIHHFTERLPWLEGEDLDWVMGRGVCEWLGWPLLPSA